MGVPYIEQPGGAERQKHKTGKVILWDRGQRGAAWEGAAAGLYQAEGGAACGVLCVELWPW